MRLPRRPGKGGLTLVIAAVFLIVSLAPRFTPRALASDNPAPPLPVAEDALGQQPEQETPEISISVDIRDGHLVVRVVDIWGPGRVPLVVRSYTNNGEGFGTIGGTFFIDYWSFNHHMQVTPGTDSLIAREADGNQVVYKYDPELNLYVKTVGTYSTMAVGLYCYPVPGDPGGQRARAVQTRPILRGTGKIRPQGVECEPDGSYTATLPKGGSRRYAPLIQEERDANGNVTTFTPITFANGVRPYIQKVRDPVGREITYDYERNISVQGRWYYRVRRVADPYGRAAMYTYDANGRLAGVTNAAGRTTGYTYDTAGRLIGVTNARGHTTVIQWTTQENQGRVTRVTAPGGAATQYAYTISAGRVTQAVVTNARGHATTHAFYAGGDENYSGNLERLTDPLGNVTQYAYDARHNVIQVTDPRGHRTTYQYNARNKVTRAVRAAGTLNLTTTLTWDDHDNLLSVTNPRSIRTTFAYDTKHNLTHVRKAAGTSDESTTQYVYNTWGGVTQVIDPRGNTTSYTYTARRQIQSIIPPVGGTIFFTYDAFDDQRTKIDGGGRTWTTEYDASRLVTRITDPLGYFARHQYDENGNRTATWDPKNQATTFTYDNRDRLRLITDPRGGQTQYEYDTVSNLLKIINARGHETNFVYDAANRLTQVRDALNQVTTYGYDAAGNRTRMTDRKAQVHQYAYDPANRLTSVIAGGQTISYTYDAAGNRLTMADPTGTTTYQYDNLDRQTRTTYPDGRLVQATYDRAGNRTSLTNPGGITTTATYDAANRLTQMVQGTLTWTFAYDGAGNRTRLTHPNGTSTDYAYLNNHWLFSITDKAPGGATFQSVSYTYDQNGNRLTQTDSSGTTIFTYDALNRLTQAAYPGGYGTYSWTYDAVGNRTQQTAPSGNTAYVYDANSRLLTAGSTTYSYDANGNLLSISTGQTFAWDVFNRMTQATGSGGTVTHTYNGDGLKTRRVGPDGTRNYYYDGIKPIWETDAAGAMTAQLDRDIFGNLLSRREASGARRYYHFDGLGSTTALTSEPGATVATLLYDAWGNQRAATGSDQGRYRFTGAELDTTTGLYHMGARFYDPTIGRWLSEDAVQDKHFEPATLNFYAYVYANPLAYTDPDGRVAVPVILGMALAVGAVIAAQQLGITTSIGLAVTTIATGAVLGIMTAGGISRGGAAGTVLAEVLRRNGGSTDIIGWVTGKGGQLVAWLEKGTGKAGFDHIAGRHLKDFVGAFGKLTLDDLRDIILQAAAKAGGPGTHVVDVAFKDKTHTIKIIIGDNGFIVSAFPW